MQFLFHHRPFTYKQAKFVRASCSYPGAQSNSILLISISKTVDFIQFTGDRTGVELDLPQITEWQKELHTKFHTIAKKMGLVVIKNDGADGSQFLDINIHGDLTKVTDITSKFIKQLYEIEEEADLIFTTN